MTKIAVICLGSYHIKSWSQSENYDRQVVYSVALSQLIAIADSADAKRRQLTIDLFIVDNTVDNAHQIIPELSDQFTHPAIKSVQLINNNSLGQKNKGAGEYTMCKAVIDKHREVLEQYDWIVYYTMRQIIISANIFSEIFNDEKTGKKKSNMIVGGLFHTFANGRVVFAPKESYCDMIFAMRPKQFLAYLDYLTPEELTLRKIGSEQNLYRFISEQEGIMHGKTLILNQDGVMRFDAVTHESEIV